MSAPLTSPPALLPELTSSELRRFNRQIILPEFGIEAQRRLKAGSVLLIGLGGLGSPASLYWPPLASVASAWLMPTWSKTPISSIWSSWGLSIMARTL